MRRGPGARNPPPRTTKAAPAAEPLFFGPEKTLRVFSGVGPRVTGRSCASARAWSRLCAREGNLLKSRFLESRDIPVTGPGTRRCEAAWLRQGWGQAL